MIRINTAGNDGWTSVGKNKNSKFLEKKINKNIDILQNTTFVSCFKCKGPMWKRNNN